VGLQDRVAQLESRVAILENRVDAGEDAVKQLLDGFGGYKNRTATELADIQSQLRPIIATLVATVEASENRADVERTERLLRRARNNLTRAQRAATMAAGL
jgi:ABC-type transporter Mla subunit MlaD